MLILSMKNAGHLKNPSVKILKTKKISITAATEFKANIDGEPLQGRHFQLEMVPRAIRIDFNREFIERVRM
jgi:diacylglycerol kinase family enzyme